MGDLEFYENFGAEEGPGWRKHLARPPVQRLIQKWRQVVFAAIGEDSTKQNLQGAGVFPVRTWFPQEEGVLPWLSTSEALESAKRQGRGYLAPDPTVVAMVHDKAFAINEMRLTSDRTDFDDCVQILSPELLADESEAAGQIERWIHNWPQWLRAGFTLKPRWGTSGRGRVPGRSGRVDEAVRRGFKGLARKGGAILEPWLHKTIDLSAQFAISNQSEVCLLGTTRQWVSASGMYQGNSGIVDDAGTLRSGTCYDKEMIKIGKHLGKRMADSGFCGPFGVDAMVYGGPDGQTILRPCVEVNARWTAGTIALGQVLLHHHRMQKRTGIGWKFSLDADNPIWSADGGPV
jgi:hypothetical protein